MTDVSIAGFCTQSMVPSKGNQSFKITNLPVLILGKLSFKRFYLIFFVDLSINNHFPVSIVHQTQIPLEIKSEITYLVVFKLFAHSTIL